MKHIIISICILLSFLFVYSVPIHAQKQETNDQQNTQDNNEDTQETNDEAKTLDETLQQNDINVKLNPFQIVVAILAPLTFLAIGYLLIKKFKL